MLSNWGLVASLSRPGGNVTGFNFLIDELTTKQLGLLHDLVPQAEMIGLLRRIPNFSMLQISLEALRTQPLRSELSLKFFLGGTEDDIDAAFARVAGWQARGAYGLL